ncbi:LysE family translocator [Actinophytocola oryzae]|uniref:Threonine/homoserine/homoserine lactone efflux protein n=1 Tax=Actinophytocola oryzae TaxID=502181 RepID=A0A4R7UW83_9PSEU|nr:LysE family translocator [Actinophytocola oryzae]TDV41019.1 threonine/homoserine/homoserine lactone efflux protein [Actinophytocola oryzae]
MLVFIGAALVIIIIPGPDQALMTRQALVRGKMSGFASTMGGAMGLTIHASLAAFGLSALLVASPVAFNILKIVGAVYLVWIGVQTIRMASRAVADLPTGEPSERRPLRCIRKGFLTNALNPKLAVFFVTFLPQFLPSSGPVLTQALTYCGVFALLYIAWFSLYVFTIDKFGSVLRRRKVRAGIEYVTGVLLLGFGAGLAMQGV